MYTFKKIATLKQLDRDLRKVSGIKKRNNGQINTYRKGMNMSMQQMAKKMGLSAQGVYALEKREKEGNITIKKLQQAASVLGMQLHYTFIPVGQSIEDMVEKKARIAASRILAQSNRTMDLEDQGASQQEREYLLKDLTAELKNNLNKVIWD